MTRYLALILLTLSLYGCASSRTGPNGPLARITLVDRNGITQTISTPDRLSRYQKSNFLASQPYQKVMRVFQPHANGVSHSVLTSYHPNGQVMQLLQAADARALGTYKEWFANGQLKIECEVMGGIADLTPEAQRSWLFHGISHAWNEDGTLAAKVTYDKGALQGTSIYYHANGAVWKQCEYIANQPEGEFVVYRADGSLLYNSPYHAGKLHGNAKRYWTPEQLAADETYVNGLLQTGIYWNPDGSEISRITDGYGFRPEFGREAVAALHEYQKGEENGAVKEFLSDGSISREYHVQAGELHGLDIEYYAETKSPKIQLPWDHGLIQGEVKTWYEDGTQQSAREFNQNKKHGLSTAWYQDGSLMLMEEYESNLLQRGQYLRRGDSAPVSTIVAGNGTATLFDGTGALLRKVPYKRGQPEVE